jgi:hypothetical protein
MGRYSVFPHIPRPVLSGRPCPPGGTRFAGRWRKRPNGTAQGLLDGIRLAHQVGHAGKRLPREDPPCIGLELLHPVKLLVAGATGLQNGHHWMWCCVCVQPHSADAAVEQGPLTGPRVATTPTRGRGCCGSRSGLRDQRIRRTDTRTRPARLGSPCPRARTRRRCARCTPDRRTQLAPPPGGPCTR